MRKTKKDLQQELNDCRDSNRFLKYVLFLCAMFFVCYVFLDVVFGEGVEHNPFERGQYERDLKSIEEQPTEPIDEGEEIEVTSAFNQVICWNERTGTRKMETPDELRIPEGDVCVYEEYFDIESFREQKCGEVEGFCTFWSKMFAGKNHGFEQIELHPNILYKWKKPSIFHEKDDFNDLNECYDSCYGKYKHSGDYEGWDNCEENCLDTFKDDFYFEEACDEVGDCCVGNTCIVSKKIERELWLPTEVKPDGCSVWACGYTLEDNPEITNACLCHKWKGEKGEA